MTLQRLVLTFKLEELIVHTRYRSKGDANPGIVRRRREVSDIVREGLQDALRALHSGRVDIVGTSGYTTREDVLCTEIKAAPESLHKKLAKGA